MSSHDKHVWSQLLNGIRYHIERAALHDMNGVPWQGKIIADEKLGDIIQGQLTFAQDVFVDSVLGHPAADHLTFCIREECMQKRDAPAANQAKGWRLVICSQ